MPRKANYSKAERKRRALTRSKARQQTISELWKIKKVYDACGINLIEYFNKHKEIPPLKVEAKPMEVLSSSEPCKKYTQSSTSSGKAEVSDVEEEEDSNSESE